MKKVLATLVIATLVSCVVVAAAGKSSELYGRVTYKNGTPASGVNLTIGNYSVTTDSNGDYRMKFLAQGLQTLWISPPGKRNRSRQVRIGSQPTRYDIEIDW